MISKRFETVIVVCGRSTRYANMGVERRKRVSKCFLCFNSLDTVADLHTSPCRFAFIRVIVERTKKNDESGFFGWAFLQGGNGMLKLHGI